MDSTADTKTCPSCGTSNRISNKFCVECGTPLPITLTSDTAPTLIGAFPTADTDTPESTPAPDTPSDEHAPTMIGRIDPAIAPGATDTPPPKPGRRKKKTGELPSAVSSTSTSAKSTEPMPQPPVDARPNHADSPIAESIPTQELPTVAIPSASDMPPTMEPPTEEEASITNIPRDRLLMAEAPTDSNLPPTMQLPPSSAAPVPATNQTNNNRLILIAGGIVAAILILACLAFGTFAIIGRAIPSTATPRTIDTPTSEAEKPTNTPNADLGILKTAQAEQDATATAQAEQPTERPTLEATEEPTEEPTATEEPTPEPPPELISTSFTEQEATDARTRHDNEVKTYRRLLFETFEEGNRTKARWNHGQEGRRLVNNRYELTIDTTSTYNFDLWKQQPDSLGDAYTVEMEARFVSTKTFSRIGITFDVQEDSTKNWLYLIGSDGNWYVFRNEQRVGSGALPSKFAINPNTPYVLWVWRLPSGILFFFNGELVAFVTSEAIGEDYPTGKVGVVGVSGSADADVPVTVVVDNFLVARK